MQLPDISEQDCKDIPPGIKHNRTNSRQPGLHLKRSGIFIIHDRLVAAFNSVSNPHTTPKKSPESDGFEAGCRGLETRAVRIAGQGQSFGMSGFPE